MIRVKEVVNVQKTLCIWDFKTGLWKSVCWRNMKSIFSSSNHTGTRQRVAIWSWYEKTVFPRIESHTLVPVKLSVPAFLQSTSSVSCFWGLDPIPQPDTRETQTGLWTPLPKQQENHSQEESHNISLGVTFLHWKCKLGTNKICFILEV